jgi:flavin reductase (DIM6/NTAB) family NADH-FMN oxidoreductase RutF
MDCPQRSIPGVSTEVPNTPATDDFVSYAGRNNFYQTCAFIPMSFALVTTVHENGETGIGPHALVMPFGISPPYSMLLISRGNSATAANIRRTGKCALNYIEFDRDRLTAVSRLGYPGQSLEDKQKAMPFTLLPSPSADRQADPAAPRILGEAFQIIECSWDRSFNLDPPGRDSDATIESRFVLQIDHLLMRRNFHDALENGGTFPIMPIFYGYRSNGGFWFAEHSEPFSISPPQVEGSEVQQVFYLANRIDNNVRFTREACAAFTKVPRPFLKNALQGTVSAALAAGVSVVDEQFVQQLRSTSSR